MLKSLYRIFLKPIVMLVYDRLIKPIVNVKDSPHSVALGATIGMWVALTPTVGIQMTVCLIICSIVKANILIAIAMCWISNPVTFLPMYYGYYRFGLLITNTDPITWQEFSRLLKNDFVVVGTVNPEDFQKNQEVHAFVQMITNQNTLHYTSYEEEVELKLKEILKENNLNPLHMRLVDDSKLFSLPIDVMENLQKKKIPQALKNLVPLSEKAKVKIKKPKKWWQFWKSSREKEQDTWWQIKDKKKGTYNLFRENDQIVVYRPLNNYDVLEKIEKYGGYAFIDDTTYLQKEEIIAKENKKHKTNKIMQSKILENFPTEQTFLGTCLAVLTIGFDALALPLWLGSLIIATFFAIPTYPITYRIVAKSQAGVAKLKEKIHHKEKQSSDPQTATEEARNDDSSSEEARNDDSQNELQKNKTIQANTIHETLKENEANNVEL
ncbi:MAG: DUF2062 domain-containing protein [Planctomycetes bacterium]|jgi:uncharacterized protein (DUF2062 family)|nr:DUF2062 domain-containing protein [Planctomycetota bacterium]